MLVMLQTATLTDADFTKLKELVVSTIKQCDLGVVSVYLQFNDSVSDAARPDAPLFHIYGEPRLKMPLLGLTFELGPLSFFQSNTVTCAALYSKAIEWLQPRNGLVLDVCCGVGTIGMCAAQHCCKVIGVEMVPEAIDSARANATLNKITNAEFHVGKAEDVLPRILGDLDTSVEVGAIVDPPRAGLHHTVTAALSRCTQLNRIVYVSCNPESLAEDVVRLTMPSEIHEPFVPVKAVAVDMFPHTLHCEMVLLLERASLVAAPIASA